MPVVAVFQDVEVCRDLLPLAGVGEHLVVASGDGDLPVSTTAYESLKQGPGFFVGINKRSNDTIAGASCARYAVCRISDLSESV